MPQASRLWCLLAPRQRTTKGTTWARSSCQIDDEGWPQREQHVLIQCRLLACGEDLARDHASHANTDRKEECHRRRRNLATQLQELPDAPTVTQLPDVKTHRSAIGNAPFPTQRLLSYKLTPHTHTCAHTYKIVVQNTQHILHKYTTHNDHKQNRRDYRLLEKPT